MGRYYLHGLEKKEIIKKVEGILALGAEDIHIIDNTHLEGEEWDIDFIAYGLHCPCEDKEQRVAWEQQKIKQEVSDDRENFAEDLNYLIHKINAFQLKKEGD